MSAELPSAASFDGSRTDLAQEFRLGPLGRHSPDLQHLLNLMREPRDQPFHVLVTVRPGQRWALALMQPGAPAPPVSTGIEFESLEAAEWYVFKVRWQELTGRMLELNP